MMSQEFLQENTMSNGVRRASIVAFLGFPMWFGRILWLMALLEMSPVGSKLWTRQQDGLRMKQNIGFRLSMLSAAQLSLLHQQIWFGPANHSSLAVDQWTNASLSSRFGVTPRSERPLFTSNRHDPQAAWPVDLRMNSEDFLFHQTPQVQHPTEVGLARGEAPAPALEHDRQLKSLYCS